MNSTFTTDTQEVAKKSDLPECKAFMDISKYFSKEEWANMGYSEKTTYVYMKRNYETMSGLGLRCALPSFMCLDKPSAKFNEQNSEGDGGLDDPSQENSCKKQRICLKVLPEKPVKERDNTNQGSVAHGTEKVQKHQYHTRNVNGFGKQNKKASGFWQEQKTTWSCRLRERKNQVIYEEISDPEEDD